MKKGFSDSMHKDESKTPILAWQKREGVQFWVKIIWRHLRMLSYHAVWICENWFCPNFVEGMLGQISSLICLFQFRLSLSKFGLKSTKQDWLRPVIRMRTALMIWLKYNDDKMIYSVHSCLLKQIIKNTLCISFEIF